MKKDTDIKRLKQKVEACFGQPVKTSRHFDLLCESILKRTGILLSATTLKRFWGYLDEHVEPRLHTLDTLSRYAGWSNWQAFEEYPKSDIESGPVGQACIDVRRQLRRSDTITLTWHPDRVCDIQYLGDGEFEIVSSVNTRLKAGDHFRCSHIISNEPLYLDHLVRNGIDLGVYVCGRKSGVLYSLHNE